MTKDEKTAARTGDYRTELRDVVKEDLVGVSDWKGSKFGFLTGYSAARRSVATIGRSWSDSRARTAGMFRDLLRREEVPSLEDGGDAAERFEASMRLHRRSERDLENILVNTARAGTLYGAITALGLAFGFWTMYEFPPASAVSVIARFGPLPMLLALAVKHLYTNWMVRRRRLDGIGMFLASLDWMPVKTFDKPKK